jgi:hypothetical protein
MDSFVNSTLAGKAQIPQRLAETGNKAHILRFLRDI